MAQITIDVRPEVAAFALLMEAKLKENDHKGGWKFCKTNWLLKRLREETDELDKAMNPRSNCSCREAGCPHGGWRSFEEVRAEAADVANFAMMISDNHANMLRFLDSEGANVGGR